MLFSKHVIFCISFKLIVIEEIIANTTRTIIFSRLKKEKLLQLRMRKQTPTDQPLSSRYSLIV
jgi:hypothetical protein